MEPAPSVPIRVAVIAPRMLSGGLENVVRAGHPELELAASAPSAADIGADRGTIDVVVLFVAGELAVHEVSEARVGPRSRLIVVTSVRDKPTRDAWVVAGVRGILHHADPPAALLQAIRKVHEGQLWIDRDAAGRILVALVGRSAAQANDPDRLRIETLTRREREMIAAFVTDAGAPTKVIAGRLFISEYTLRNHLSSIYSKLGLANRVDLYAYATRHQLGGAQAS